MSNPDDDEVPSGLADLFDDPDEGLDEDSRRGPNMRPWQPPPAGSYERYPAPPAP